MKLTLPTCLHLLDFPLNLYLIVSKLPYGSKQNNSQYNLLFSQTCFQNLSFPFPALPLEVTLLRPMAYCLSLVHSFSNMIFTLSCHMISLCFHVGILYFIDPVSSLRFTYSWGFLERCMRSKLRTLKSEMSLFYDMWMNACPSKKTMIKLPERHFSSFLFLHPERVHKMFFQCFYWIFKFLLSCFSIPGTFSPFAIFIESTFLN